MTDPDHVQPSGQTLLDAAAPALGPAVAGAPVTAGPARRWGDLGIRAMSGLVLIALAIGTAQVGGDVFLVAWIAAAIVVLWEWQRLTGGASLGPSLWGGTIVLVAAGLLARGSLDSAILLLLVACLAQALAASPGRRGWAAGGMAYAGLLIVSVTALRFSLFFGSRAVIWLFATVWATDVFAYFGGRLIGGKKLWPRISPSKTWSGTICGVIAGAFVGTFAATRDLPSSSALGPVFALSLAAAILAQAGDAFESGIKRHFAVKDTSRLIPGHGGLMDRLDGFIAAAIFAFAVGLFRNQPSVASGLFYWA